MGWKKNKHENKKKKRKEQGKTNTAETTTPAAAATAKPKERTNERTNERKNYPKTIGRKKEEGPFFSLFLCRRIPLCRFACVCVCTYVFVDMRESPVSSFFQCYISDSQTLSMSDYTNKQTKQKFEYTEILKEFL
jgi:hypothetical protein